MKVTNCWLPVVVVLVACIAGFKVCNGPVNPYAPFDNSGKTSIVIFVQGHGWAELRGPARWEVLDDCTGPPVLPIKPKVAIKAADNGIIENPHCINPNN